MNTKRMNLVEKKARGFSLIETMMTVALFGILVLAAIPATSQWRVEKRVASVATALAADLVQARMLAIMKNAPVIIRFDPVYEDYALSIDADGNGYETGEREKYVNIHSLDGAVTFGSNATVGINGKDIKRALDIGSDAGIIQLTFYPNGSVHNHGAIYLIPRSDLGSRSDRQKAVTISSTGRVSKWSYDESAGPGPWREKHLPMG